MDDKYSYESLKKEAEEIKKRVEIDLQILQETFTPKQIDYFVFGTITIGIIMILISGYILFLCLF